MMKHHFAAGVYMKEQTLPALHTVQTHKHKFDHFWLLAHGCAAVEVEGRGQTYQGPCAILIEAGKAHKITALTDTVSFCIHATDVVDPDKIDHELIEGV